MTLAPLFRVLKTALPEGVPVEPIFQVLQASLEAVDPYQAVRQAVDLSGSHLQVGERTFELKELEGLHLVGVGKAAPAMARALVDLLGSRLQSGVVVSKLPPAAAWVGLPSFFTVIQGGHPVPDAGSLAAARAIQKQLAPVGESDLVICLISGGGSALMTDPQPGITLQDLQTLTALLLESGARIDEINTIRKHLDRVKGGGLARAAAPASLAALVLSDVVGSPLDMIASGPTVPDPTTFEDAWAILKRYALMDKLPDPIAQHLQAGLGGEVPETPKAGESIFQHSETFVVGSNLSASRAGVKAAAAAGFQSQLLTTYLQGEAQAAGRFLGSVLRQMAASGEPLARPACLIAGGETTVVVRGDGLGGRNLEVALGVAQEITGLSDVVFISLATDGEDGPTDSAGAVVTGQTISKAGALGLDAADFLRRNDSYHFFEPLDALIRIGPTGTNVNDINFLFACDDSLV